MKGGNMGKKSRLESDSLGEIKVPNEHYWGAQHNVPWTISKSA